MLRQLFVDASDGLFFAFIIWKVVAAIFGLSYRRKWMLATDIIALSAIVGSELYIHFAWRLLIRPGTERAFVTANAIYAIILIACTFKALAVDKANSAKRKGQELHRVGDGGNDGGIS